MPRGREAAAAVSSRPGENERPRAAEIAADEQPGERREAAARVLHHLFQRDAELVGHDPIHLAHLSTVSQGTAEGSTCGGSPGI